MGDFVTQYLNLWLEDTARSRSKGTSRANKEHMQGVSHKRGLAHLQENTMVEIDCSRIVGGSQNHSLEVSLIRRHPLVGAQLH